MDKEIALVQSRTFWAALLAFLAVVAQALGWAQAFAIASDPHTADAIMTFVSTIATLAAILFARLPKGKITSILPPASGSSTGAGTAAAIVAAMIFLPLLSGCVTVQQAAAVVSAASNLTVTQAQLDALRTSYDAVVLTPAANYRQLGYCATGASFTLAHPCADRAAVAKLQSVDASFQQALATAQSLVSSGSNSGLSAAYALAQQALKSAAALAATLPTATISSQQKG